jgi:PAS domain S-box-containing protein
LVASDLSPEVRHALSHLPARQSLRRVIDAAAARALAGGVADAMIVVDHERRIVAANAHAERLFGYGPDELTGQPLDVLVPERFRAAHAGQTKEYVEHPRARSLGNGLKLEGQRKDGSSFPVDISLSPLQARGGRLTAATVRGLSSSEARYRDLVEASIQGILVHQEGIVLFANPALVELLGYPGAGGLVGRPVDELVAPEDRAHIAALREVWRLGSERAVRYETRMLSHDGAARWFDCISSRTSWNEAPADLVTMVDVSKRKQAEEAVRASEAAYRLLLEEAPDAIFVVDQRGRFLSANARGCELSGYPSDELRGLPVAGLFTADEHQEVADAFLEVRGGQPLMAERRLRRRDGVVVPVEVSARPLPDGRVQGIVRDISARKAAEDALRASEARYRGLVEGSIQGISIRCRDTLVFVNAAFAHILGWDGPQDVIGRPMWDFLVPGERERVEAHGAALLRGEMASVRYEVKMLRRDGATVWTDVFVSPSEWDGEPALLATVMDITERRRLEEQYRQAQKMEAVGQLAGGVAHDFNNLLTAILGYTDMVREDLPPDDPRRADLDEVRRAADRAAALTRQLLAFSRRQVLQPRVLDVNEVVDGMAKMLRRLIGEDVQLRTTLAPGPQRTNADPGQLEQVIMNLAVNARDAMPEGGDLTIETGTVTLDAEYAVLHPDARPGPHVLLAISDGGNGMTADVQAHIFEPFFTTKGPGKGTGLGLATVYGIVKQSGGHVTAYSEAGRGTTMKVYLPVADADVASAATATTDAPPPTGSETILLVEDEEGVRRLTRGILERYGYHVLQARDGAEAVALCHGHRGDIHLMVTDVVMPGMGGPESAELIRQLRPGMKVLFMSGYADRAVTEHRVLGPDTPYLQKPFTPAVLARKVREVLDR